MKIEYSFKRFVVSYDTLEPKQDPQSIFLFFTSIILTWKMAESNFEIDVATPLTWREKLIIADRFRQRAFYRYWTLFREYFNADLYKITRVVKDF